MYMQQQRGWKSDGSGIRDRDWFDFMKGRAEWLL
jgi:hypothetical protein